ncbi:hypothetical protein H671_xg20233 [Cricetulus griseus]|uniref:Uncharacterized protein n=1 Tax=Cricetulus griseus TaxID=10029 RepID=A0A061HYI7_CRIGR|nr:hypothetical protein H671_xg20233 [Cricetulus griseus]
MEQPITLHIQTILDEEKSSLPHPKILGPGHRGEEEHGPSGLGDCLIYGAVEDISIGGTDQHPCHLLETMRVLLDGH